MCIQLGELPDGTQVPCRKCWQCRASRVNDYVGRCIAESKTAGATFAVTLTYGADAEGNKKHVRSAVLTYSDVQGWLKRLRAAGYPVRYFAVGEYGSAKGRAHWHVVLFFADKDKVPPHELQKNFNDELWPHGHQFWDKPEFGAFRYNMKYIQKGIGEESRQGFHMMSKKPVLGHDYFVQRARNLVKQGIAPRSHEYSFGDVRDHNDKPVRFFLRGKCLDVFMETFIKVWLDERPGQPLPNSEFMEEWQDKQARSVVQMMHDRAAFQKMVEDAKGPFKEPYIVKQIAWLDYLDQQETLENGPPQKPEAESETFGE